MEGISRFYNALINAQKNNQFKKKRQFFLALKEIYKPLGAKYEEYKKIKSENDACEQKKQNL